MAWSRHAVNTSMYACLQPSLASDSLDKSVWNRFGHPKDARRGRAREGAHQHAIPAYTGHLIDEDSTVNASQILSICSSVCAALTLMRTSDLPPGVAGGKIRFT